MVGISCIGFSSGSILLGIVTFFFKNTQSLTIASIVFLVVGSCWNFFMMKEPPRFFFRKGLISDGFKSLMAIGKQNKANITEEKLLEILRYPDAEDDTKNPFKTHIVYTAKQNSGLQNKESTLKLLFVKDTLSQIIRLISLSLLLFIVFYVSAISISDNLGSMPIQWNEIMMGFSQLLGNAVLTPYLHKLKRVKTTMILLILTFIVGGTLLLITGLNWDKPGGFLAGTPYQIISVVSGMMINIINSMLFVVYFAFAAELFDVKIRGLAVGIPGLAGKLLGTISPQISDLARKLGISILGISVAPVVIALPLVYGMRETLVTKKDKIGKRDTFSSGECERK
jgi:hypothetical protein